jgi:uncharacterized SAM-binding protein YcdF (DUF218 family)
VFVFSKLVAALISPLGTALLLGIVALVLARSTRGGLRRVAYAVGALAVAWLWFWSMPVASGWLRGSLEDAAGERRVEALPAAPAIVVLGGAVEGTLLPWRAYPDLKAASDRVWHAARLYRAGKAPLIVLSGGTMHPGEMPEAQAMRQFLVDLGVPASAMLLEAQSQTTTENAADTARLLQQRGIGKILLVTSALHMRRARGLFERAGLEVIPAPTDYEVVHRPWHVLDVVPDTEALDGSGRAIKEVVGRLAGR